MLRRDVYSHGLDESSILLCESEGDPDEDHRDEDAPYQGRASKATGAAGLSVERPGPAADRVWL